jgi:hypothetical protein
MSGEVASAWSPTRFLRHEGTLGTSMQTAIVQTDAGRAHIKVLGNPQGEHALACEYICTRLAGWFGVPIVDYAILPITEIDTFPLKDGRMARPGPAFATRTITAEPWSGSSKELKRLVNPQAITRLVVFDTWVRNDDRYPPVDTEGKRQSQWRPNYDNVLLTPEDDSAKNLRLIAIDFGRGLIRGSDLPGDLTQIVAVRDEWVYGLFPEFYQFVSPGRVDAAVARLREVTREVIQAIMDAVPKEWQVDRKAVSAVCNYTCSRAGFLADTIKTRLAPLCFPQGRLFPEDAED